MFNKNEEGYIVVCELGNLGEFVVIMNRDTKVRSFVPFNELHNYPFDTINNNEIIFCSRDIAKIVADSLNGKVYKISRSINICEEKMRK